MWSFIFFLRIWTYFSTVALAIPILTVVSIKILTDCFDMSCWQCCNQHINTAQNYLMQRTASVYIFLPWKLYKPISQRQPNTASLLYICSFISPLILFARNHWNTKPNKSIWFLLCQQLPLKMHISCLSILMDQLLINITCNTLLLAVHKYGLCCNMLWIKRQYAYTKQKAFLLILRLKQDVAKVATFEY